MSPRPELLAVASEVLDHLARVARTVEEMDLLTVDLPPDLAGTWAIAGHLHSFYTGCEAVLLRALEPFDGPPPEGPGSHARLLERAALTIDGLRPAILTPATGSALDRYRAFRHFFRHAYGVKLEWPLIEPKVRALTDTHERFRDDLERFVRFLRGLADPAGPADPRAR